MGFHNPTQTRPGAIRQAEAAIRLWIKTAKEDGLEIPRPRGRLVYA
jgi:predicted RNase H-like HicB family nuclease